MDQIDPILLSVMCGALVVGALVQSVICGMSCINFSAAFLKKAQSSILHALVGSMRGRFRIRTIMFVIAVIAIVIGFLRDSIVATPIAHCWVENDGWDFWFVTDSVETGPTSHARSYPTHDLHKTHVPLLQVVATGSALLALVLFYHRKRRRRARLRGRSTGATSPTNDVVAVWEPGPKRGVRESIG
jgi:hypothetical protein